MPVINLVFSGNGKAEPEVARLLAELDSSRLRPRRAAEPDAAEVVERMPGFIETIRAARPRTKKPIVLVEHLLYPNLRFRKEKAAAVRTANASLRPIYHDLGARLATGRITSYSTRRSSARTATAPSMTVIRRTWGSLEWRTDWNPPARALTAGR